MVNGIDKTGAAGPLGPKPVDRAPAQDTDKTRPVEQDAETGRGKDTARISPSSAEVARYQEMARLHREAYGPQERTKKLDDVRRRVQENYYDQPEVIDKMAGGIAKAVQGAADETGVERARRRSEEEFYDRPEVVDKTAEKLIEQIIPGLQRQRGGG